MDLKHLTRIDELIAQGRIAATTKALLLTQMASGKFATVDDACNELGLYLMTDVADPTIASQVIDAAYPSLPAEGDLDEATLNGLLKEVMVRSRGIANPVIAQQQLLAALKARREQAQSAP